MQQVIGAGGERQQFRLRQARFQGVVDFALGGQVFTQVGQVRELLLRDRMRGPIPDHGAEFFLVVEAERVVDAPEAAVGRLQDVAALAVGVVGQRVEERELPQPFGMLLAQLEEGAAVVGRNVRLQRAGAVFQAVFALDRGRDQVPAEFAAEPVGGDLAAVEIGREIPERVLAPRGLVDRVARLRNVRDAELEQEDVVGGVGDARAVGDLGFAQAPLEIGIERVPIAVGEGVHRSRAGGPGRRAGLRRRR